MLFRVRRPPMVKRGTTAMCTSMGLPVRVWMVAVSSESLMPHLFGRGAVDEVEGRGGVEHPALGVGIHKDRNVGEAERVLAHLQREGIAWIDGHGRIVFGQGSSLTGISISSCSSGVSFAPRRALRAW